MSGLILPYQPRSNQGPKNLTLIRGNQSIDIQVPWWVQTPEQVAEAEKLKRNQFFLLRQGELGEVLRCTRCNTKHTYFTLMCVERPFDGLEDGLYAYWYHAGRYGQENFLNEVSLQRYEAIAKVLAKNPKYADVASSHPMLAKSLGTETNDFDTGAVSLGLLEPITAAKAAALAWNINLKGLKPEFKLKGLEPNG